MPNYVFESGDGARIERFYKLGERPGSVIEGSTCYRPIITDVHFLSVAPAQDRKTDDELLDDNIKESLKVYEAQNGSPGFAKLEGDIRDVRRALDSGPVKRNPDEKEQLSEAEQAEMEALARGDGAEPGPVPFDNDPHEEPRYRDMRVPVIKKDEAVTVEPIAPKEVTMLAKSESEDPWPGYVSPASEVKEFEAHVGINKPAPNASRRDAGRKGKQSTKQLASK